MKNIAVIPARGGSKRLPNKNILQLNGLPLLAHSIIYAQNNPSIIDSIYVSTDDPQIKEIALKFGAKVIDRPAELSGDLEPTVSAIKNVLDNLNVEIDNLFLLQPTNPLRPEYLVRNCYEKFISDGVECLFTVSKNEYKLGKIKNNSFIPYNYTFGQRSQDLEPLYFENGLLYICKAKLIMNNTIISENALPYIIDESFPIVDIDTLVDFEYASYLLNK